MIKIVRNADEVQFQTEVNNLLDDGFFFMEPPKLILVRAETWNSKASASDVVSYSYVWYGLMTDDYDDIITS